MSHTIASPEPAADLEAEAARTHASPTLDLTAVGRMLALQRTIGNHAVARLVDSRRRAIQRTVGDGSDLTSPRFSRIEDLEAAFDDERDVQLNDTGRGVQAIQQALYDIGFPLPVHGADGRFGPETKAAVEAFQRANPPLAETGRVDKATMIKLNTRFAAFALPAPAARSANWTTACVRSILCPWAPHTVEMLRTRITLKSFDNIFWTDEEWDGAAWQPKVFPGGGYNTGTEIGVLNSSCENMAETLYHEVLHADQPSSQTTTLATESYAYRIGEEFSIAAGLGGRASLRSTGPHGRRFADPAKVRTFVASKYPSVPAGGGSDEIVGKAPAAGHVQLRRPDGTFYTRAAAVGERVPGPMSTTNEVTHPQASWTCP
jgi:peptidoglycan hydrolase-like protein with peptidoglycan-binding domain